MNLKARAIFFVAILAGCGMNRTEQCQKLVERVNATSNEIAKPTHGAENALAELARTVDRAAGEVSALALSDPKLKEHQRNYCAVLAMVSSTAKRVVEAAEKKDVAALQEGVQKLKDAGIEESRVVNQLNHDCQAGS